MKTGSEAERAQGPSGDGRIPSPRSRRPDPHGALPSAVPPTPAFANPSYPTNPALPAQSLGEGPGPYRVLSRSAARGNTRALGFCPPGPGSPCPRRGARLCAAAVCGCRCARAAPAGVATLGTGGSCSPLQKLPFLLVVGRQRPGRGLTQGLAGRRGRPHPQVWRGVSKRSQGDSPHTSLPWGRRVPCF